MALSDRSMGMILAAGGRRPTGMARARAKERDQTGDDGAQQRQENNGLIHSVRLSPASN